MTDSLERVNRIVDSVLHHLAGTPYTNNQKELGTLAMAVVLEGKLW